MTFLAPVRLGKVFCLLWPRKASRVRGMIAVGVLIVAGLSAFAIWSSTSSPAAKAQRVERARQQAQLACPHCQTYGAVTARPVVRKVGVSGGKATGALLTGGVSMLLTGLSRKQPATRMFCSNCGVGWDVA